MLCLACGREAAADFRFCPQCGSPIEAGPVIAEEARPHVMSDLRGEERLVTVVFADLTESVRRTSDLSPEEANALVSPLLEAMVELMMRHGGRIDRFLGDGVLAVFGVPAANEDDPIRAVRAAMELRERATTLGLAVTVGVNTGRVYFGPVGSDLHEELTVMGPTVNLAARLQSAASADQILVGATTWAHVHRAFRLEPVTLDIKGIAEPVIAYLAEYEADHPDRVRGIEGLHAGLVGRRRELEALTGLLDGSGHTAVLIGEAGLGKSRLASELNRIGSDAGYGWLEGRCLEVSRHLPYGPVTDLLRRHFGDLVTLQDWQVALRRLTGGELTNERVEEMAPFLSHLLGRELASGRDDTDPDRRMRLTVSALVDFLTALARSSPLIVFFDDVHWADDASIRVLDELSARADGIPLLLLLAARPDSDAPSQALLDGLEPAPLKLRLRELAAEESRLLIDRLLNESGVSDALASQIVDHAGGNPFYVEEILRTFIQQGALVRSNGSWKTASGIASIPLPESIEGLLMSRFDRLPQNLKQAARVASVIGDGLTEKLLDAVAGREMGSQLAAMASAGITTARGEGAAAEHTFVHALTRQAIYSSLLPSHRSQLHGLTAQALEGVAAGDVARLAHHYAQAADDYKAVHYLVAAGEQAMAAYANETALHHLDKALQRVTSLPSDEQSSWRARIRLNVGEILGRQAQHLPARTMLLEALDDLVGDPLATAKAWRLIGQAHRLEGSTDDAQASYQRAEEALDHWERRDTTEGHRAWIEIQQERSFALYFGGRSKELPAHNEHMVPVVEAHGSLAQQIDLRRAMLLDRFAQRRWLLQADDVAFARRTLQLARTGTDPQRTAENTFGLGFTLLWADQVHEAAEVLAESLTLCSRVGDTVHRNRSGAYLAVALRRAGRVDDARHAAQESLELSTTVGSDYYRGHALATLCWVAWRSDDPKCVEFGRRAYEAWGTHSSPGFDGLQTEFAWMAVWPLVAAAHGRQELKEATAELRLVTVPWERPAPADLGAAVGKALATGDEPAIAECLRLARRHMLL